ncbi:MAG TPA: arginine--tRNA ligase [bacterium]|jgi:arginyl-tRNA synthetase
MSDTLDNKILQVLRENGLPEVFPSLREIPFPGQLGVALSNVFQIARAAYPGADKKQLKEKADEIAQLIGYNLDSSGIFEKVEVVKGYVNCFFKPPAFASDLISNVLMNGISWAESKETTPGRAMVEYSQPNTHKAFHIGHVRNVVTGSCLIRCMEYSGRDVVAANYYGDIGTHVFKSLWYLENYAQGEMIEGSLGQWLGNQYQNAEEILSSDDTLREEALRGIAERWYSGDPQLIARWEETRGWSLDEFRRIYKELDARFDVDFFESQVEVEGLKIVDELVEEGIAAISGGARIVEIDVKLHEKFPGEFPLVNGEIKDKYRVLVLVKSDGSSLYGSKDLSLAKKKFEDFEIDESIYVVDNSQKFYFEQVFQILRIMGFPQWEKCFHLSYELVMLPEGKMSSRKGQVVLYDDVKTELERRALDVVREKNPNLPDKAKKQVASDVAMGALKYGMLRVDTNKIIHFDFDDVLDLEGRSAPYIQYAGARASSILRKAKDEKIKVPDNVTDSDFSYDMETAEIELIKMINRLPEIVRKVSDEKKPIHLASYAYELAVAFSDFYHACPVLKAEGDILRSRLLLVKASRITIKSALWLLGINSPDVM